MPKLSQWTPFDRGEQLFYSELPLDDWTRGLYQSSCQDEKETHFSSLYLWCLYMWWSSIPHDRWWGSECSWTKQLGFLNRLSLLENILEQWPHCCRGGPNVHWAVRHRSICYFCSNFICKGDPSNRPLPHHSWTFFSCSCVGRWYSVVRASHKTHHWLADSKKLSVRHTSVLLH